MYRDPDFAREQILAHFNTLPTLHFEPNIVSEVIYAEPKLIRPADVFNANRPFPVLHSGLNELLRYFELGSQKLEYGRTERRVWREYFRFHSDHLFNDAKKGYYVAPRADNSSDYVNETNEVAINWFQSQLIPWLKTDPGCHAYVLGDPGAGKSTLLKYLINTNHEYLSKNKVIMSRFEFLKFRYKWCGDLDFTDHQWADQLRRRLSDYMSYIVLRDVLWSRGYTENSEGRRNRAFDFSALKNFVTAALRQLSPNEAEIQRVTVWVDEALEDGKLDFSRIRSIPHEFRILLSNHLTRGFSVVIALDGLDCISVEDADFESERFKILDVIMRERSNLTTFMLEIKSASGSILYCQSVPIPSSALFIMRENTFYLHEDGLKGEVRMVKAHMFRVGPIDPEVAIYNLVNRAVDAWIDGGGLDRSEGNELANLLIQATFLTLKFINRAVRTHKPSVYLLGLFCGNIRILFQFMARLLNWFLEDAIRDGFLKLTATTTVKDILLAMTGSAGLEVLQKKNYRIIEILMFSAVPWFENQIYISKKSSLAQMFFGGKDAIFRDNSQFTGVVDNIFNYHSAQHARNNDQHCLLEKVRIIQLLENKTLTSNELAATLFQRIGYTSPNLENTIKILIRTQMLNVLIKEQEIYLSSSTRGIILISYLGRTLPYLEHVFHRTLFPKVLVERIEDERRMKDVDRWASASIRNAFIFLTYLKFVENNKANGRSVPAALRIFEDTRSRVLESIRRILSAGEGYPRHFDLHQEKAEMVRDSTIDHRNRIIRIALRQIENSINDWERAGIATSSKIQQKPGTGGRP